MKQRLLYLDAIKGVAILMVIMGHVDFFIDDDTIPLYSYVVHFITSVHMPIFLMIAGFFSQKVINTFSQALNYWKDKFIRLILPLIFVYPLWTLWRDNRIHYDGIHLHFYWFTINLLVYFAVFFVQKYSVEQLLRLIKKPENKYLELGGHLIITSVIYYVFASLIPAQYPPAEHILVLTRQRFIWLYPYLVLGFMVGRLGIIEYFRRDISGAIAMFILLSGFIGIHYLPLSLRSNFYSIADVYRVIAPTFMVLLIYIFGHICDKKNQVARILILLGQWSLPIYFTHYFFMPVFPGIRTWLGSITNFMRLGLDLFILLGGTLFSLIPTLTIIYCIKLNPYLDFLLCGEKQRLLKK